MKTCSKKILYFVFVAAFFSFLLVSPVKAASDCIFCSDDEDTYKMEKQFIERIEILKSVFGNSIDEVVLAATVLHKEGAYQAIASRYEENFDKTSYKTNLKSIHASQNSSDSETTREINGDLIGVTGGQVDLLTAAAIIMADSAGWGKPYDEEAYKKALAGSKLIGNNDNSVLSEFYNGVFCVAGAAADAVFTTGNVAYQFVTGQNVISEAMRTGTRWQNMKRICDSGYIGAVYEADTITNETQRQAYKNGVAQNIIDLANYYKKMASRGQNVCLTGGSTQATIFNDMTTEEFINMIGPMAQADYSRTGVFASVTIAQAILESGWGKSGLTQQANNMFGIKCSGWEGKCVDMLTGEYGSNGYYEIVDSFRMYDSVEASIGDHSNFLLENERYENAGVFEATTASEQIKAIHAAGYATSPTYSDEIINDFLVGMDLTKWDVKTNVTSSSGICSPVGLSGWSIRTIAPAASDSAFLYEGGSDTAVHNRGQCVWYAKGRAVEIVEELGARGNLSKAEVSKIRNLLLQPYGNGGDIYDNTRGVFNGSNNIREPKAGSYIVWKEKDNYGHVGIVEDVNTVDNTITLTEGWANGGSCPNDWSCVDFENQTYDLDEFYTSYGMYRDGSYKFDGYVYFLEPLS